MFASGTSFEPAFRPERVWVGENFGVVVEEIGYTVDAGLRTSGLENIFGFPSEN